MTDATVLAAEQAAGLRKLADMIEQNPEVAEHLGATWDRILVSVSHVDDSKAVMAAFARAGKACGVKIRKEYDGTWGSVNLDFTANVSLHVYAGREQVCKRVVVGTETVTRKVPDPDALASVPEVEVTEEVEVIKWECDSILAPNPPAALAGTAAAS